MLFTSSLIKYFQLKTLKSHKKRKTKSPIIFSLHLTLFLNKWDYSGARGAGLGLYICVESSHAESEMIVSRFACIPTLNIVI